MVYWCLFFSPSLGRIHACIVLYAYVCTFVEMHLFIKDRHVCCTYFLQSYCPSQQSLLEPNMSLDDMVKCYFYI